jgi:TATA-binding protein-associated factor Taf7
MAEQKLGWFEALKTSTFSNGVVYQTYVTSERLVAVKIGGQLDGGKAFTAHFGLLGGIIGYFLEKRLQKKRSAMRAANEERSLDDLLSQDEKNFEVRFEATESAELSKSGILTQSKATLIVKRTGAEPVKLGLMTKEAAADALRLLEQGMQGRLQTDPRLRG